LDPIVQRLSDRLEELSFSSPVTHVYNPLTYAGRAYQQYLDRYGQGTRKVIMMGMNPGPWGMAQTGVPFGEVGLVRDWLKIDAPIGKPLLEHPARPVTGLLCARSEVSGKRLWGAIRDTYEIPERFFDFAFVANYCPLLFLEASGANRTPDKLPKSEREPLLAACDEAFAALVQQMQPELVIGIGKWAAERALQATGGRVPVVSVPHPSPANPAANRGWGSELKQVLSGFQD
jgi:single-strand selective monofunctional uracil DNA glycosylase